MHSNILSLKNPVWQALGETHNKWCLEFNGVRFYTPEICPFGAFTHEKDTLKALNAYAKHTDKFFLVSESKTPIWDKKQIALEQKIEGCQMVLENLPAVSFTENIVTLTEKHLDEIYHLIWLVMPRYYRKRTFEMGNYFGIFKNNTLVSIAGQRMQTNAWTEISAVVTHPNYTRRGYAKQLTAHVINRIIYDKKQPILHTTKGNPAIKLYENLGFQITRDMHWWHFRSKKES